MKPSALISVDRKWLWNQRIELIVAGMLIALLTLLLLTGAASS
jgi:hypothetical protein